MRLVEQTNLADALKMFFAEGGYSSYVSIWHVASHQSAIIRSFQTNWGGNSKFTTRLICIRLYLVSIAVLNLTPKCQI